MMMQRTRPLKPPPKVANTAERPMNRKLITESQFDKDVRLEMQKLEQQFLLEQEARGGPIRNNVVDIINVEPAIVQKVPNVSPGMIFGPDKTTEKELKNRKQMEYRKQLDDSLADKSRYANELMYSKEGSPTEYRDNFNDSYRYNDIRENILPKLSASTYDIPKVSSSGLTVDTYMPNEIVSTASSPQKSPTKARMRLISDVYGSEQVISTNKNLLPDPNWRPSGKHISLKHTNAVQEQKQALEAQILETRKRKQEEVLKRRIEEEQEELRIKNELYQLNINEKPANAAFKELVKNDQVNNETNKFPLAAQPNSNVVEKTVQQPAAVVSAVAAPSIYKHNAPAQLFNPGISSFHNNIPSSFSSNVNSYPEFRNYPPVMSNAPPQQSQYNYSNFRPTSAEEVDSFLVNWQRQVHEQAAQNVYFPSFYAPQVVKRDSHPSYVSDNHFGEFSSNSRFIAPTEDPFVLLNAFRMQYTGNKPSMESSLRSHSNFVDAGSDNVVASPSNMGKSPSNTSLGKSPSNGNISKSPSNTSLGKAQNNTSLGNSPSDAKLRNEVEYDDNQLYDLADEDEEGIMP
jgi:hypothetical protein